MLLLQNPKQLNMKKAILPVIIIVATTLFISCSRGISMYDAANGKAKCGRHIR